MDDNPYQSPTVNGEVARPSEETWLALMPFIFAVPAVVAAILLWFWRPLPDAVNSTAFGVLGAILIFDLPVCMWVVCHWLRYGRSPDMSLSPLIPSRQERAFRRTLRERRQLDDEQFYATFYADSDIVKDLPAKLRKSLEIEFGQDFVGLRPTDNLLYADDEVDFADVLDQVESDFGVDISAQITEEVDCTFDALVRAIAAAAGTNCARLDQSIP